MTELYSAIGYLRRDVSGARQQWDEIQMRSLAKRLGYDLKKTIVFGPDLEQPVKALRDIVTRLQVDAVIVPSAHHLDAHWATVPAELVKMCDVITVTPEQAYARWGIGQLPAEVDGA